MKKICLQADASQMGERIDKYLAGELCDYSRSFLQKQLKDGNVTVNGKSIKSSYLLCEEDENFDNLNNYSPMIKIEYGETSENEEVDSSKFFDKLSSNTYPDYYIYKSILDDEYTIETNYGTIKKKKSKDIYNLNFEFIKKS